MMKRNHSKTGIESDSSSEDDTSKFEEAALSPEFILKSSQLQADKSKDDESSTGATKKSGRRDKTQELQNHFQSEVQATPEMRQFVGTKLAEILDKSIKETKCKSKVQTDEDSEDEGIKLFRKSKDIFIEKEKQEQYKAKERPDLLAHRKPPLDSDEDLQSVAVSSQWVLQQQGVYYKGPDESRSKVVTEL